MTTNYTLLNLRNVNEFQTEELVTIKNRLRILETREFPYIELDNILAKGDLIVGTAAGTVAALTVGAAGTVLIPDSAQTTGLKWSTNLPIAQINAVTSAGLAILDDGSNYGIFIEDGGNVIIGSNTGLVGSQGTPKVQIQKTSNAQLQLSQTSNNSGGAALEILKRRSAWGVVSLDDVIGGIYFSAADGTDAAQAAKIIAYVDGTPGSNDMPGRIVFSTSADGSASPTEALRINSSQQIIIPNGYLGVGSSATPTVPIHLQNASSTQVIFQRTGATAPGTLAINRGTSQLGTGLTGSTLLSSDNLFIGVNSSSNVLGLIPNGGLVGINVPGTPVGELELNGDLYVTNGAGTSSLALFNDNNISTGPDIQIYSNGIIACETNLYINIDSNNDSSNAALIFRKDAATSGGTQLARLTEDAQLAIGTITTPQGQLHAHDGTGGFLFTTKTGVAGTAVVIVPNGTGDVVRGANVSGGSYASDGTFTPFNIGVTNGSSTTVVVHGGTDDYAFTVAANGELSVARTTGSLTYTIVMRAAWL